MCFPDGPDHPGAAHGAAGQLGQALMASAPEDIELIA